MTDELKIKTPPEGIYYARLKYQAKYNCSSFTTEWSDLLQFQTLVAKKRDLVLVTVSTSKHSPMYAGSVGNALFGYYGQIGRLLLAEEKSEGNSITSINLVKINSVPISYGITIWNDDGDFAVTIDNADNLGMQSKMPMSEYASMTFGESRKVSFEYEAVDNVARKYIGTITAYIVKTALDITTAQDGSPTLHTLQEEWISGYSMRPHPLSLMMFSNLNFVKHVYAYNEAYRYHENLNDYPTYYPSGPISTINASAAYEFCSIANRVNSRASSTVLYHKYSWPAFYSYGHGGFTTVNSNGQIITEIPSTCIDSVELDRADPFVFVKGVLGFSDLMGVERVVDGLESWAKINGSFYIASRILTYGVNTWDSMICDGPSATIYSGPGVQFCVAAYGE